ncbi:MAG: type II toxin-antitoxin system Phd/YefM family antitoxin [Pyrinomonadaceae bacterium]
MHKTVNIDEINDSLHAVIALAGEGEDVLVEEHGRPIAKVTKLVNDTARPRTPGLGKGYWVSDDFDDELPDEFWGFDKDR